MTDIKINTRLELTNISLTVAEQILAPRTGHDATRFSCAPLDVWMPLPGDQAPLLRDSPLFDPEDSQDASPNAGWFVTFTERFRGRCWLIGYRVGDDRDDARVSLEGILIAKADMTPAAETLLRSKCPNEWQVLEPGRQNTLNVAVVRVWWD